MRPMESTLGGSAPSRPRSRAGKRSAQLHLARKTVEAYLSRLYIRYRVVTRTELGVLAEREQMLSLPVDRRRTGPSV